MQLPFHQQNWCKRHYLLRLLRIFYKRKYTWDQLPESTDATGERLRSPWDSFDDTLNNFESHEDLWQFVVDLCGILSFSSPVCVTGNVTSFENVSSLVSIQDDYSDQVNCNSRKQNSSRQNTIGEEQNRSTCELQRACVCLTILSKWVFVFGCHWPFEVFVLILIVKRQQIPAVVQCLRWTSRDRSLSLEAVM